jgi:hypothetical protein
MKILKMTVERSFENAHLGISHVVQEFRVQGLGFWYLGLSHLGWEV